MQTQIISLLLSLPSVIIALSVHEASHAYIAHKLGDNTARNLGRLTLNPLKHLDILGFLTLLLFRFGWAKPVPVVSRNLKKPRRDFALIALAGPVSNLLLAFLGTFIFMLLFRVIPLEYENETAALFVSMLFTFVDGFIFINLGLALFNLIPLPPLDGSRLLDLVLPARALDFIHRYERYFSIVLILVLYTGIFSRYLSIAVNFIYSLYYEILSFIPFL